MLLRAINAVKTLRSTAIDLSKAKSERINSLRKQYDALLEEDRKRKDRNEYIMGWLDRVRISSTLSLPIQERLADSRQIRLQQPKYTHKHQPIQRISNIKHPFNENLDESSILNAVSQKYILIPKGSPEYKKDDAFNPDKISSINNDLDWKSKYGILNDLKLDEKEEKHNINETRDRIDNTPTKDSVKFATKDENLSQNKTSTFHLNNAPLEDNLYKQNASKQNCQHKLDETNDGFCENSKIWNRDDKRIKYGEIETKTSQDSSEKDNISQEYQRQTQNKHNKINFNVEIQDQKYISRKEIEDDGELSGSFSQINENNHEIVKNALPSEQFKAEPDVNKSLSDKISRDSTVIGNVIVTNDITSPHRNSSFVGLETNDETQYNNLSVPQNTENNKDICNESHNINIHSSDIQNSENDSERQPTIDATCPETIDNIMDDQGQIEEFETEQKELFYSEDHTLNYTHDEEQATSNDNYENNEQYSYYEATKEDPNNYAAELNEHEETTEQYDPRYQQQYGEPNEETQLHTQYPAEGYLQNAGEDYEQQQYYENYEQHHIDDPMVREQPHYDNSAYEEQQDKMGNSYYVQDYAQEITSQKESLENVVENQLNIEDGYANATEAVSNNEESSTSQNILTSTILNST